MEGKLYGTRDAFDSDLALERRRISTYVEGVDYKRDVSLGGVWERIKVTSHMQASDKQKTYDLMTKLVLFRPHGGRKSKNIIKY